MAVLALCFTTIPAVHAQVKKITAAEGKNHIGERATVCGKVVSTHHATRSKGEPTFLNLDERYPRQLFTILIWGNDRAKFGDPETKYQDKRVCVTGKIASYQGSAEITVNKPEQVEIQE